MGIFPAKHVSRRKERRRGDVQQTVDEPAAPGLPAGFAPVGQARYCRAHGTGEADAHRERCGAAHPGIAVRGRVERERRCPGPDRHVGEHGMKRMAKPHAVNGVLRLLSERTSGLVRLPDCLAQRFSDPVDGWVFSEPC
jgi:hypothetical protein